MKKSSAATPRLAAAGKIWTVARFPNGSWSYGGPPTSPEYSNCEIWRMSALNGPAAVRKAQAKRSRDMKKGRK